MPKTTYVRYAPTGETMEVTGRTFSNVYVRHLGDSDTYAVSADSITMIPAPPEHHYAGIYEYSVDVPSMYVTPNDDPAITIYVSAAGGGTVGEEYAHNDWYYAITVNGREFITGEDIRTNATPGSHASIARTLASVLSAYGESFHYHDHMRRDGSENSEYAHDYTQEQRDFLSAEYERFSSFADDTEDDTEDE